VYLLWHTTVKLLRWSCVTHGWRGELAAKVAPDDGGGDGDITRRPRARRPTRVHLLVTVVDE